MNLPNRISLTRILIIPIIIAIYVIDAIPCGKLIATILFAIAAYADFVEGMIARKTNQVTNMGKFLDESADKLLTTGALLLILQDAIIPVPFGVVAVFIILARDQIVSLLRRLATQKGITIAADKWGKMKTVVFDISIPMLLLIGASKQINLFSENFLNIFSIITFVIFSIGLVLNIFSCVNYIVKNKSAFLDINNKQ